MNAPASWNVQLYRACALCDHGTGSGPDRRCTCPAVIGRAAPMPVAQARDNHGPCGPEAHHMRFPGLLLNAA